MVADKAQDAGAVLADKAQDVGGKAADKAGDLAVSAKEKGKELGSKAADKAGEVTYSACHLATLAYRLVLFRQQCQEQGQGSQEQHSSSDWKGCFLFCMHA